MVTIAYADMFDYPLTLPELHRYLVGTAAELADVTTAVESLAVSSEHVVYELDRSLDIGGLLPMPAWGRWRL